MRDADAFDATSFLGPARRSQRDPYRLALYAQHLDPDERPLALLPVHGGTLLVTNHRLMELRPHLEVHGAWNVKEFRGYEIRREMPRASIRDVAYRARPNPSQPRILEGVLLLTTAAGTEEILVSRGPETSLTHEDIEALRAAVLGPQPK